MSTAKHTPVPNLAAMARFTVKPNWFGKGFVLMDGMTIVSTHDLKREAVSHRLAAIAKATGSAS